MQTYFCPPYRVAQLAARIEEKGVVFYSELKRYVRDEKVREVFQFLADQELDHRKTFTDMAEFYKGKETAHEYAIDVYQFIEKAMQRADDFLNELKADGMQAISLSESLNVGIKMEAGMVYLYTELQRVLTEDFGGVLAEIIQAEKSHLEMLQNVKNKAV